MDTAWLVDAAAQDDQAAWDALVKRYTGLLWSIARGYGLSAAEAADVAQTAWLRLAERLDTLFDPEHVGAWLATTTRRECLRVLRHADRVTPTDDETQFNPPRSEPGPQSQVLAAERAAVLWQAVDTLSDRCRRLLRLLMADPPPAYEEVAAVLDMPVGSIGPTRRRCLRQLRETLERTGITLEADEE